MTSEVREFARFIAPLQSDPNHHIGMVGMVELGIVKELEEFGTRLFIERGDDGVVVGAAGFDHDEPLERGYLYGPWSIDEGWSDRADRLFALVLDAAPAIAKDIELVFNRANVRAADFGEAHGFEFVRDHFTMAFARHDRVLEPDPEIRDMDDQDRNAIVDLHERSFAKTWPTGEQLLEQLEKGPDRRIFVLYDGAHLAGYIFTSVERATGEAFVDNVGVDERFRSRGFATRLLRHGLWWMFSFDEVTGIELSVRAENAAALKVYEKAAFRKLHAIRQMRMSRTEQT